MGLGPRGAVGYGVRPMTWGRNLPVGIVAMIVAAFALVTIAHADVHGAGVGSADAPCAVCSSVAVTAAPATAAAPAFLAAPRTFLDSTRAPEACTPSRRHPSRAPPSLG